MSHGPNQTEDLPSAQRLAELFWYDANSGDLIRRVDGGRWGREPAGTVVGSRQSGGYLSITALGRRLLVHRVGFAIAYGQWPQGQIDHIDGNRSNNRLLNLREAEPWENSQNRHAVRSDNKHGFMGIRPMRNKWQASIRTSGVRKYLGVFDTSEAAQEAYLAAKRELHQFFVEPTP